jgi:hypothetical protein
VTDPTAPTGPESVFVKRLLKCDDDGHRVTLLLGSGLGDPHAPRAADIMRLADRYAEGRNDEGDLRDALDQVRDSATAYEDYRRVLTAWLAPDEFDAIAQQSVLLRYRPQDLISTPLGSHGFWQPITLQLGEDIENDLDSWRLSRSVSALGALLANHRELFGSQVITTGIDPTLEIAIRRAGVPAVSLLANGTAPAGDRAVAVYHLHGFWRPLPQSAPGRLTEDIDDAANRRIARSAAGLLSGDLVCVLGTRDRVGTIRAVIEESRRNLTIIWASQSDAAPEPRLGDGVRLEHLRPFDNARMLPDLAAAFSVSVPSAATQTAKTRHPAWERIFVSQPDSRPPALVPPLLRELERRFGWSGGWPEGEPPGGRNLLVYWPVRLRRRASVIHMAQALVAGALAARDAKIIVSFDDLNVPDREAVRGPFIADLRRWITHVALDPDLEFKSLTEYVEDPARLSPEAMLRPTDPWVVARDFYGRPMSLYTALAAVKALPHLSPMDLEESGATIVHELQRHYASRILTPMTIWAHLHYLMLRNPSAPVITLGGRDEGLFWDQWHQIYKHPIGQLYNPRIKSLTHESGMVHWKSADELGRLLETLRDLQNVDDEGRFLHWLFQNAVLLPAYLTGREVPHVDEFAIDSWAAFKDALDNDRPVLDMLAEWATDLYRGPGA